MDRVPVEVLKIILEFLPMGQMKDCIRVCKKWKATVDCLVQFDCLVVYSDVPPVNQRFFHTNQVVSLQHCMKQDVFLRGSEFKKSIYRKFRRLYIYDHFNFETSSIKNPSLHGSWVFSEPTKLNWLSHLEELHLWIVDLQEDCKLTLPNLKTFKVLAIFRHTLALDAPQLTNLSVFNFENLQLQHPQTIQTLEFRGPMLFVRFNLKSFLALSSLKYLRITQHPNFRPELEKDQVIEFLGNLKEIHVHYLVHHRAFYPVIKRLKVQTNDQIQIFFAGLEMASLLHDQKEPSYLPWPSREDLDFYTTNYSKSETLPFKGLAYQLVENWDDELEFFTTKMLPNLEFVEVGAVKDERALGNWLKSLDTLIQISFDFPLSQEFFSNILPASRPNVEILNFSYKKQLVFSKKKNQMKKSFKKPLDFSFLFQFQYICKVFCNRNHLDPGVLERLFTDLPYFKFLSVRNVDRSGSVLVMLKRENMFTIESIGEVDEIENFDSFQSFMAAMKRRLSF